MSTADDMTGISCALAIVENTLAVEHGAEFGDFLRRSLQPVPRRLGEELARDVLFNHRGGRRTIPSEWLGAVTRVLIASDPRLGTRLPSCPRCAGGTTFYLARKIQRSPDFFRIPAAFEKPADRDAAPYAIGAFCSCASGRELAAAERRIRPDVEPETAERVARGSGGALSLDRSFFDGTAPGARRIEDPLVEPWLALVSADQPGEGAEARTRRGFRPLGHPPTPPISTSDALERAEREREARTDDLVECPF